MTRLFLDTEWADPEGKQLVSLALVDSTGQHRFYAEVDPLPLAPTPFVREQVYPLLERGEAAMTLPDLTASLRTFLARLPEPRLVIADHPTDFSLLRDALAGLASKTSGEPPLWRSIEVTQGDVLCRVEAYFEREEEARRRRHHAGVDAEALRWAFLSVSEGTLSDDDLVFIGQGDGLFATTRNREVWRANSAAELLAKLDADGVDRKRLYLIVPEGPSCPDHALSEQDAAAFTALIGNEVKRGA